MSSSAASINRQPTVRSDGVNSRSVNDHVPQQIRIHRMCRMRLTGVFFSVNRIDPYQPNQTPYPSSSDADMTPLPQQISEHPSVGKRIIEMQSVKQRHPRDIGLRRAPRTVIRCRSGHSQHLRLSRHRQLVVRVDHFLALSKPDLVSAVSKKSFSKVSWAILACSRSRSTFCSLLAPPS